MRAPLYPSFGLVTAALALIASGCDRAGAGGPLTAVQAAAPATSSAVYSELGEFHLVRQDGAPIGKQDLLGTPTVIATFFTTCYGPCPAITKSMAALQDELAGTRARLVSLSVDPTRDTPDVLSAYARTAGADSARWWFLTGEEAEVYAFCRNSLYVAAESRDGASGDDASRDITHDERLVVVDAQGRVRGWYDHAEQRDALLERVRFLLGP